jgi:ornithine carbamoyltransferase
MDFSQKVVFPDTVFAQEVDGEMVLLDMNTENYFGLDSVASDIWKLLQEGKTIEETYETLQEIYEVDPDVLKSDLETFISGLLENKLAILK